MSTRRRTRPGFTLFELLIVLAILVLFAAMGSVSLQGMYRGNRAKAAADQIRGEMATARAWAMEDGMPYRVALSADGTRIRRAPDADFEQTGAAEEASVLAKSVEYAFEKVTAVVEPDQNGETPQAAGNWVPVAVVMPDGTCRDDGGTGNQVMSIAVRETEADPGANAIHVVIRGITGQTRVVTKPKGGGKQ